MANPNYSDFKEIVRDIDDRKSCCLISREILYGKMKRGRKK